MVHVLITALLALSFPPLPAQASNEIKRDVDRLVAAAEAQTGSWRSQAPPAIAEVATVARHGKAVVPLLIELLSNDPAVERDRKRWKVQQQVSLTLAVILNESQHCGRIYCDGDPPERIARIRAGWQRVIDADKERQALSSKELLARFKEETSSWRQFETARSLAATNDRTIVAELAPWLTHEDRHLRGNAAFVLARLGDPRGFDVIARMLKDRSPRSGGQGTPTGHWTERAQIRSDRYYAGHLLGDLRDPRGVELLIPLLNDDDVGSVAPWSLAEIGDRRAVPALIAQLDRAEPSSRITAILALEQLKAREALPKLRTLLQDSRTSGPPLTVADAARRAIEVISR